MYRTGAGKPAAEHRTGGFGGINRRSGAADGYFLKAENVTTEQYPAVACGMQYKEIKCGEEYGAVTGIKKIWNNVYHDNDYVNPEGVFEEDGQDMLYIVHKYNDKYSVHKKQVSGKIIRAGRYYFDTDNKNVYYTVRENSNNTIKEESLTKKRTFTSQVKLDNSIDGRVTITISKLAKSPYFEKGDFITVECDDWRNNSSAAEAAVFASREPGEASYDMYACTYTVDSVSVSAGNGYTHTYNCIVTGCGGGSFVSPYTTVTFGEDYAPITLGKRVPEFKHACFFKNRIAVGSADGRMIMLTSLGSIDEFYDYSGEETDSYYVEVPTTGEFVGCVEYNDTLLAFKRDNIHILYGSTPSDFQIAKNITGVGCVDIDSVCECAGKLYFLSVNGFCSYGGGSVTLLENRFGKEIASAKAVSDGIRYFAMVTYSDGTKEIVWYDTRYDVWCSVTDTGIIDLCVQNKKLYVTDGKCVYHADFSDGDYVLESVPLYDDGFGSKAQTQIRIRTISDEESYIDIETASDNGEWKKHKRVSGGGLNEFTVPLRFSPGHSYRYRLVGRGRAVITDIQRRTVSGGYRE